MKGTQRILVSCVLVLAVAASAGAQGKHWEGTWVLAGTAWNMDQSADGGSATLTLRAVDAATGRAELAKAYGFRRPTTVVYCEIPKYFYIGEITFEPGGRWEAQASSETWTRKDADGRRVASVILCGAETAGDPQGRNWPTLAGRFAERPGGEGLGGELMLSADSDDTVNPTEWGGSWSSDISGDGRKFRWKVTKKG